MKSASYPAARMEAYPVSKAVSNARNERPELIAPLVTAAITWQSFRGLRR